ncbi:hypothetical protein RA307_15695 [Xanthobacteraceae bacterium Astr-EGSB]|uniref:DUF58 domain-containing protein n=1 Tax=Astrobacterium formosum TaxID=3069710 RepID=UPI0027AEF3D9|nr:hypothetical protein [Xanthobacteraceae bacterium Astr-EGSB]
MTGAGSPDADHSIPMPELQPLAYRLRWRPRDAFIGAHPGGGEGAGGTFQRHVPLLRHPDPRRIDLRATFRDPMEEIHVRQYTKRSAIVAVAVVDLSGSMGFEGRVTRMRVVAELCATLALSARRMGDRFALIGCDADVRDDVFVAPTRHPGVEVEVFDRLMRAVPQGESTAGLLAVADRLPARPSLVFIISDFLMPLPRVDELMNAFWRHDVVPVVVRDRGEEQDLPAWGLIELRDLETGRRRLTLMRPALREAWRRAGQARRVELDRCFRRRGRVPFHVVDGLDADALAEHLLAG